MANISDIKELARKLNLMNVANGVIDISNEVLSNKDYLHHILSEELRIRAENKIARLYKDARLPTLKFDYTNITQGLGWQLERIKEFNFSSKKQNIFIVGDCCSGKTSLAAQIANLAITQGIKVFYATIDDLVFFIKTKSKLWQRAMDADLLVIDDFFYIEPTEEELLLIYKTLMFLAESRSLIIITNRSLSRWKEMKVDIHLVNTLQKRLLNNAQIITLTPR